MNKEEKVEAVKDRIMGIGNGFHNLKIRRPAKGPEHGIEILLDGKIIRGISEFEVIAREGELTRISLELYVNMAK